MKAAQRAYPAGCQRWLLPLLLLSLCTGALRAQAVDEGPLQPSADTTAAKPAVTNETILRMAKAGLDDTIILQTIEARPCHFDVGPDELIALKQSGVSQPVIAAMQSKTAGFTPRRELGTVHRNEAVPEAEQVVGIVPGPTPQKLYENGVYYKNTKGIWLPLKTEKAVQKSGGFIKSTLTYGIIKQDLNGYVNGPHSPLHLAGAVDVLIFAPSGVDAAEYDFIRFRQKSDGREFRATTGGIIHSKSGADRDEVEYEPTRIAPQMYTFRVPADILKGEYGVLPPGITVNKVYTFAIVE